MLPVSSQRLAVVGLDVVDVLDVDQVAAQVVEVLDQRAVPAGPEEQAAIGVAQRPVVRVHRQRVGGGLLRGEADLEARLEQALEPLSRSIEEFVEHRPVFGGNGEVQPAATLAIPGVLGRLDQVLLEGGAASVRVLVKEQNSLGPVVVVETLRIEQGVEYVEVAAARRLAIENLPQRLAKGEAVQVVDELDQRAGTQVPRPGRFTDGVPVLLSARAALKVQQVAEHPTRRA